jgi:hypothetical protein
MSGRAKASSFYSEVRQAEPVTGEVRDRRSDRRSLVTGWWGGLKPRATRCIVDCFKLSVGQQAAETLAVGDACNHQAGAVPAAGRKPGV